MIDASIRVIELAMDVEKCAKEVTSKEGRLDVLINNAGISEP